ncbi:unnamed protein product [Ectocarpus fasciculatus]
MPSKWSSSPTECESACLVGCLRRLQHWSMVAIHDEYHMMTMRNTRYSTSQRFIERFDLDIVTLKAKANLPPWYRNHLDMLEEERIAEAELASRDPDRPARAWTHGVLPTSPPPKQGEGENEGSEKSTSNKEPADPRQPFTQDNQSENIVSHERGQPLSDHSTVDGGEASFQAVEGTHTEIVEGDRARSGQTAQGGDEEETNEGREDERRTAGGRGERRDGSEEVGVRTVVEVAGKVVPDFRLNGFVYVCPLVSEGCTFTAKAWLQDEDD